MGRLGKGGQTPFPYLVGSGERITRQLDEVRVTVPSGTVRVGDFGDCFPLFPCPWSFYENTVASLRPFWILIVLPMVLPTPTLSFSGLFLFHCCGPLSHPHPWPSTLLLPDSLWSLSFYLLTFSLPDMETAFYKGNIVGTCLSPSRPIGSIPRGTQELGAVFFPRS